MTLDAAAQLLTGALMLLQSVSVNPALPQTVYDGARSTAERAITEATRIIAKPAAPSAGVPSCTITADKENYYKGEIIVFTWTTANAESAEFVPDSGRDNLVPPVVKVRGSGDWRVVAAVTGYPFATMKVTGAGGMTATCSEMVYVY